MSVFDWLSAALLPCLTRIWTRNPTWLGIEYFPQCSWSRSVPFFSSTMTASQSSENGPCWVPFWPSSPLIPDSKRVELMLLVCWLDWSSLSVLSSFLLDCCLLFWLLHAASSPSLSLLALRSLRQLSFSHSVPLRNSFLYALNWARWAAVLESVVFDLGRW